MSEIKTIYTESNDFISTIINAPLFLEALQDVQFATFNADTCRPYLHDIHIRDNMLCATNGHMALFAQGVLSFKEDVNLRIPKACIKDLIKSLKSKPATELRYYKDRNILLFNNGFSVANDGDLLPSDLDMYRAMPQYGNIYAELNIEPKALYVDKTLIQHLKILEEISALEPYSEYSPRTCTAISDSIKPDLELIKLGHEAPIDLGLSDSDTLKFNTQYLSKMLKAFLPLAKSKRTLVNVYTNKPEATNSPITLYANKDVGANGYELSGVIMPMRIKYNNKQHVE